jgi:hypothetical protein
MKLARLDASDILEADAALSAPDHQMIAAVLNRCNPFDDSLIE